MPETIAAAPEQPGRMPASLPRWLFALAMACAVAAAFDGITLSWQDDPERGLCATAYSVHWVWHHLTYGLGVTLGAPVFHVSAGDPPIPLFNWHHPPLYSLWLAAFAAVLGDEPWVLRFAHLVLFLPSVPALYFLVARHSDRVLAGVAMLLYATCPYATYFGFMVLQDGLNLSLAVVACWLFQLHLDQPERYRWWVPGIAFFLCGSMDVPGYFTGFALFALALGHSPLRPALRAVAVMFAVSLVAFAVTAVHYGLFLGGPLGYLRAMLDVGHFEANSVQQLTLAAYEKQFRAVLLQFGGGPVAAMALLGVITACCCPASHARRLCWLGFAVALPGIANYLIFLSHAPWHMYWPLPTFGGIAVMGAGVAAGGLHLLGARSVVRRATGVGLLLACVGTIGFGAVRSHTLIGEHPEGFDARLQVVAKVIDRMQGCTFVLTTADTGFGQFFGQEFVVGNIRTIDMFENLLEIGRASLVNGDLGFVLEAQYAETPLRRRLQQLAEPVLAEGVLLFRFRVPPRRP